MTLNDSDDALEYLITLNSYVSPSKHLKSLYSSVLWVSTFNQMIWISCTVESLIIQGEVGRKGEPFGLSDFSSLNCVIIGSGAFRSHSFVFESKDC